MPLRRRLVQALMVRAHPRHQRAIVRELVDWLYADRSSDYRREKAARVGPLLIERICRGEIPLSMVMCQRLRRLPLVRGLSRRLAAVRD